MNLSSVSWWLLVVQIALFTITALVAPIIMPLGYLRYFVFTVLRQQHGWHTLL
jgi:hypothetical protein